MAWEWDLTGFRIGAFFGMFILAIVFGIMPYILQKFIKSTERRDRFLSLGNAFAGGLFLGGGFIHLLSEAADTFEHELEESDFPYAMALVPAGFFVAFFIEKVLFLQDPKVITVGGEKEKEEYGTFPKPVNKGEKAVLIAEETGGDKRRSVQYAPTLEVPVTEHSHDHEHGHGHGHGHEHDDLTGGDHDHHSHFVMMVTKPSSLIPYILVLILSLHSIISGLAIGVQNSVKSALPVLIAILSHKWVESFALGVSLLKASVPTKTFLKLLFMFAAGEPLGILIGAALAIVLEGTAGKLLTAVCAALASGTFVYVAIIDILLGEFETSKDKYLKFLLALLGLACMSGLVFAFPHEHEEEIST